MPSRRPKGKKNSRPKSDVIALGESANLESPSEQASSCLATDAPSGEAPSNKQPTADGPPEDLQLAEDPTTGLPAGEISKDPPASGNPSENQLMDGLSENWQPAKDPTVIPPAAKAPPAREPSTIQPELTSPPKDQPTAEVQFEYQQTAESLTTNLRVGEAPEDLPALEILPDGQSTAEVPTRDPPDEEIPKEPTESFSQDQSAAGSPSEDHKAEGLPIITPATADFGLLDVDIADSVQKAQTMALDNFTIAESNDSGSSQAPLTKTGQDFDSHEQEELPDKLDLATMTTDKQMTKPDSATAVVDEKVRQTTKSQRVSPRKATKRSFQNFVKSDNLWMGEILGSLEEALKLNDELTDYLLKSSERLVKKAKCIRQQLHDSKEFIKDCRAKEMKVTRRLEKL